MSTTSSVFMCNDSVHGHLELHELSNLIIDTPEFQRLFFIKQMGTASRVYPGAQHTRGEHSIGVAHLATKLIKQLQTTQPELSITHEDIICVQLAGLCHDLGHGPYSHLFENFTIHSKYFVIHEHMSYLVLMHIIHKHGLEKKFQEFGIDSAKLRIVGEMIWGSNKKSPKDWEWIGPPVGKEFLYEIVSNEQTGIDVDKFDYYLRDCRGANIHISFDSKRLLGLIRAYPVPLNKTTGSDVQTDMAVRLCYPIKEYWNVCEVFRTRFILHTRLYSHKAVVASDIILLNLLKAMSHYPCPMFGHVVKKFDISLVDCLQSVDCFILLKDSVIDLALTEPYVHDYNVRYWYDKWTSRKLFKLQEERTVVDANDTIKKELQELCKKDADVNITSISYGVKNDNSPLSNVYFYSKHNKVYSGPEIECMHGVLLNPPFKIYKIRKYEMP